MFNFLLKSLNIFALFLFMSNFLIYLLNNKLMFLFYEDGTELKFKTLLLGK